MAVQNNKKQVKVNPCNTNDFEDMQKSAANLGKNTPGWYVEEKAAPGWYVKEEVKTPGWYINEEKS